MTANCKLLFDDIPEYFDVNTTEERKKEIVESYRPNFIKIKNQY